MLTLYTNIDLGEWLFMCSTIFTSFEQITMHASATAFPSVPDVGVINYAKKKKDSPLDKATKIVNVIVTQDL